MDALPSLFTATDPGTPLHEPVEPDRPGSLRLAALLLAATVLTTLVAGFLFDAGFQAGSGDGEITVADPVQNPLTLLHGLPFSLALLAILLAHEMGHYLACRFYRIRCTLPYVIPAPPFLPIPGLGVLPLNPFGTFGAVIRIRSPFLSCRQIFDVGIAGPLAGFLVIVPVLALGVSLSTDFQWPEEESGLLQFGEPLLFKLAVWSFFDGDPSAINLHPIGWAAWFGLLATSLNLLPFGQLDGGHVLYALFGERRHRRVSTVLLVLLIVISLLSLPTPGYLFFALILMFLGPRHPRPAEQEGLDRKRWWIGLLGMVVFVLCFIPVPVTLVE